MKRKWIGFILMLLNLALFFSMSAFAADDAAEPVYIYDHADIFTDEEETLLEWYSTEAEEVHKFGLYIAAVNDYREYNEEDVFEAARRYYILNDLGVGPEHGGLLLMLSMAERDFAIITHGEYAGTVFQEAWMENMGKEFANKVSMSENLYDSCDYFLSWRLHALKKFRTNHRAEYRAFVREASAKEGEEKVWEKEHSDVPSVILPSEETIDDTKPLEEFTTGEWFALIVVLGIGTGCCVGVYKLLMALIRGLLGRRREERIVQNYQPDEYRQPVEQVTVHVHSGNRVAEYFDRRMMRDNIRKQNRYMNHMMRQTSSGSSRRSSSVSRSMKSRSRGSFKGTSGKF